MLVEQRSGVVAPTSSLLALQKSSGLDSGLSLPGSPLWGTGCDLGLVERLSPCGETSWMSPVLATAGAGNQHHLSFMLGKETCLKTFLCFYSILSWDSPCAGGLMVAPRTAIHGHL